METISLCPDGFRISGANTIAYVKDSVLYVNAPALEILISDENDLEELDVPIGSVAFLADGSAKWRYGVDNEWHQFYGSNQTEGE